MLHFAHPWLFALLPLPLLVWRLLPPYLQARTAVRVPDLPRLSRMTGQEPGPGAVVARRTRPQYLLLMLVWAAVVASLARPQWIEEPVTKTVPTRDLLLGVDLSGSMDTRDFTDPEGRQVDRLTAVKQVLGEFLTRREGDRVGLIVFGSAAFVQAPFTEDLQVVRTLLDEVEVRMAGPKTVVGDAIGLAMTVFERSEVEERVLILLTDGNDTGRLVPPVRVAEIARDKEIVIHAVAVGDPAAAEEEKLDDSCRGGSSLKDERSCPAVQRASPTSSSCAMSCDSSKRR
jgi:Ca-activated chloride channel family protein